jgi:hypothetical protein
MSRNIVAEALSNSTHSKGEHSKGSLIHDNATEILIYGSLYASNVDRSPLFKGGSRGAVVNNFIMNPNQYVITYGLVASEWGEQPYQTGPCPAPRAFATGAERPLRASPTHDAQPGPAHPRDCQQPKQRCIGMWAQRTQRAKATRVQHEQTHLIIR